MNRDGETPASCPSGPETPRFRIWPPIAVGVPWLLGAVADTVVGPLVDLAPLWVTIGWVLIGGFVVWNGWCLALFARHRTGLLPGQSTSSLLRSGPYRWTRNPLYVGLLALYVGAALVASSAIALALAPLAWAGLHWGAVLPEERYLTSTLGEEYAAYCRRVRRWL